MIFLFFSLFQIIFARKNTHEIVSGSEIFSENNLDGEKIYEQLRFNATCDELSLDLAAQCEVRLCIKNYNNHTLRLFLSKYIPENINKSENK